MHTSHTERHICLHFFVSLRECLHLKITHDSSDQITSGQLRRVHSSHLALDQFIVLSLIYSICRYARASSDNTFFTQRNNLMYSRIHEKA